MPLSPVSRRLVPDQVFEQLLDEVVDGGLAAGDSLPSERRLAEVLGVSRPAVREALQRLTQSGLVEVRQGGSTTVRDFRRSAGLDLLPRLLVRAGQLDPAVLRSVVEARAAIGSEVVALAAERGNRSLPATLHLVIDELEAAPDPVAQQRAALVYWDHVVDAADSIVFRLMFNGLRAAYEPALDVLAPLMTAEVAQVASYRALADALAARDPDAARTWSRRLLEPATRALLDAIDALERQR